MFSGVKAVNPSVPSLRLGKRGGGAHANPDTSKTRWACKPAFPEAHPLPYRGRPALTHTQQSSVNTESPPETALVVGLSVRGSWVQKNTHLCAQPPPDVKVQASEADPGLVYKDPDPPHGGHPVLTGSQTTAVPRVTTRSNRQNKT